MACKHIEKQKFIILAFLIIYVLNCTDLLFTYTYLKTGVFAEFNPFMRFLLTSTWLTILIKLILPAALIIFFFFQVEEHTNESIKLCQLGSLALLGIYALLNGIHLYYLFEVILFSS